ncbi:bifunctional adenosylcobinamide kinase/adenosylcobinamide-phosphate guanylyltransferase [Sulfobacillus sp. hq2]|uniref:Adenosylcobinamide kinase n=1 Tax=Sulfobacillus thermotolerans TaxID=338644 RepID=A0ABN5H060_9FIRM|nr:bifunctional adenosylcobinamide kinase/adenosylcobinamide-phosphate guanylyltransferase [Sulfobacillus sp. hq2]AUW94102.1 hypothetical protein BXT84_09175 [Sulfobacillus thermotolerans]MCY0907721.1 bifunctional adenosylcobinamide kinase/adenosylcobinamide-phosphate guanylyltransferase [Sulfobacillus thermotolerans]POB09646.1 adenosylcobinamide kinase [Sulfobacillus sp. hq2]
MSLWLVLGGSASGKSAFAERLIGSTMGHMGVQYIATIDETLMDPTDVEFQGRLAAHRLRRPQDWTLWQEPSDPVARILSLATDAPVLWDGIGPVLSRMLLENSEHFTEWLNRLSLLAQRQGDTVVVSEEVGWGLLASSPQTRSFVDALGQVNQRLAELATSVVLVVAGLPLWIKGRPV